MPSEGLVIAQAAGSSQLTLAEQGELLEQWAQQMYFGYCCPLED